ncbi:MAG: flagellar motor switch protein FliN [Thermoleophilia bacterium]|nr:flagellar motor switch protein FliN [Thermoleophilia bacterium]
MSQSTKVSELLAAALQGAADVARARLGRDVQVGEGQAPDSSAILRFDLPFTAGGRLTWFISNEDATGLSDMLIGGGGDRGAVLTEMHLDALTVAFSDMLSRAVDGIAGGISEPLESGEIDLGMEAELPAADPAGTRVVLALHIDGWGMIPVVQQADADLTHWLDMHALAQATSSAAPAAATSAPAATTAEPLADAILADEAPTPAGPTPAFAQAHPAAGADNVVPLAAVAQPLAAPMAAATQPASRPGDLELLMNVPLPLTVELGSTQRTIRELVDFSIGSIIELGKLAGDPLDIKVNDRVIARGEVVVIDEEFGIRVTEIVSPEDRLRGLG